MRKPLTPADVRVGDVIRLQFQPDNPNNCTYHVRGFVDHHVVLRYWRKGRGWYYVVELLALWLDIYGRHNELTRIKRGTGPQYQEPNAPRAG